MGTMLIYSGLPVQWAYSKKSKYMYRVQWVSPTERGNLQ